jgi:uncharacterized membrane protein (DUF485 family)
MPGIDFKAGDDQERHDPLTASRNARIGGQLFIVYLLVYSGFIALNAFRPDLMAATPVAGINVAVLYGLALIVGALFIALVYGWLCRNPAEDTDIERGDG